MGPSLSHHRDTSDQFSVFPGVVTSAVFVLSHDNGIDNCGRSVCKRASKINSLLLNKGHRTYFGNYEESCEEENENTDICFVLFLTKQYVSKLIEKIDDDGREQTADHRSANYIDKTMHSIIQRHQSGQCRIIPVLMEKDALEHVTSDFFEKIVLCGHWIIVVMIPLNMYLLVCLEL